MIIDILLLIEVTYYLHITFLLPFDKTLQAMYIKAYRDICNNYYLYYLFIWSCEICRD